MPLRICGNTHHITLKSLDDLGLIFSLIWECSFPLWHGFISIHIIPSQHGMARVNIWEYDPCFCFFLLHKLSVALEKVTETY